MGTPAGEEPGPGCLRRSEVKVPSDCEVQLMGFAEGWGVRGTGRWTRELRWPEGPGPRGTLLGSLGFLLGCWGPWQGAGQRREWSELRSPAAEPTVVRVRVYTWGSAHTVSQDPVGSLTLHSRVAGRA